MFLIIFMMVNAKTMSVETGLESSFASFENKSFSGGQKPETLAHHGVIKNHIRGGFSQMKTNMEQVASICKNGLPAYNIDKILLHLTIHRENSTPAAFMKNYFQKKNNDMYNRSATVHLLRNAKHLAIKLFFIYIIFIYEKLLALKHQNNSMLSNE